MQIDVIVFHRGTTKLLKSWRYEADQSGQLFIRDGDKNRLSPVESWHLLALTINQEAHQSSRLPVDVFLILRCHLSENIYDPDPLMQIINHAHEYSWGGSIYIVWDQESGAAFEPLYRGNEAVLKNWFGMLVQSGVTDLIEIKKRERLTEPDEKKILYERALESVHRRERLRKLVSQDGWRVILRDGASFLNDFIQHFSSELQLAEGKNLAIFYDQRPPRSWPQLLERAREWNQGGHLFVGALSRSNAKDMRDLEEICEQESPGLKVSFFEGIFEWLYTFIRLARASGPAAPPQSLNAANSSDIIWITPQKKMAFDAETSGDEVRLLVTNAFAFRPARENSFFTAEERALQEAQGNMEAHCLAAAQEVGGILRHLPFYVGVEVLHCITCERLPDFIEGNDFTTWLHLGHGDERGLHEEQTNQNASSQRWVDCFNDYSRCLELVIFSACKSVGIARAFVESGLARAAIGFENKVLTQATRKLSGKVMPAALKAGDKQTVILHAFLKAVTELHRRTYEERGEDRHYSDAGPKAFAIKLKS